MRNILCCVAIGVVVGSILASTTQEWSLTGVGAGVGGGLGVLFDRAGFMKNIGVGLVIAGVAIGAAVGASAASATKEWWLSGMGPGLGAAVGGGIAAFLARSGKKDG